MKTLPIAVFKSRFSHVLEQVKQGEEIVISYGKQKEKVAVIIPFKNYQKKKRHLGLLAKGKFKIHPNFSMTESELIGE